MAKVSVKTVHLINIIKAERKKRHITQLEMARMMGITLRRYQKRETGRMSIEDFMTICSNLDIKILILPESNIL